MKKIFNKQGFIPELFPALRNAQSVSMEQIVRIFVLYTISSISQWRVFKKKTTNLTNPPNNLVSNHSFNSSNSCSKKICFA